MTLALVTAALAAVIVGLVVLVALCGWAGKVALAQRLGLSMIAAGLLWAGPARLAGRPPAVGDLIMLAGILVYVLAVYGPQLRDHLDGLDGRRDGRLWTWPGQAVSDRDR